MLQTFPDILTPAERSSCLTQVLAEAWDDGRSTAGSAALAAKRNQQLAPDNAVGARWANVILDRLGAHPGFMSATLPLKVMPPMFNRYDIGEQYDAHIDNAIRSLAGGAHRVRTDISATLFLSEPDTYEGGELEIMDTYGSHLIKLPAGSLVVYPSTSVHRVRPVTRGARVAAVFWIQSLVAADHHRRMLWSLDQAVQTLSINEDPRRALVDLTGLYHNLVREWSQT